MCLPTAFTLSTQGLVYVVDVSAMYPSGMGACASSDYEKWTVPTITSSPRCVLGGFGLNQRVMCLWE